VLFIALLTGSIFAVTELTVTVLKLTKSKKAVQIITDDGKVYQTSVNSVLFLLNGRSKEGFITTIRLPINASPDRFKPSELYDPNGLFKGDAVKSLEPSASEDVFSPKYKKEMEQKTAYEDKTIW